MAHSTIRGPSHAVTNSYAHTIKSSKMLDLDCSSTDYSIFIGYGSNAKRLKDRWATMKKQLRFENNYVALKWLLDSFVDDYLRSKHINDSASLAGHNVKKEHLDEAVPSSARRAATRSPPRTRFEEVSFEHKENGIADRLSISVAPSTHQYVSSIKERRRRPSSEGKRITGDLPIPGQYSYKYVPADYWSSYYPWHGATLKSHGIMNMGTVPGYSGYMMKTPSCSSLPTQDVHKSGDFTRRGESLKRWGSSAAMKDEHVRGSVNEKRASVNLGFKTTSMPNLQAIPKEPEIGSDEEEEIDSDPESQGDLIALSSSSLSMPNLRKIPPDHRAPLLSPPRHYEAPSLLRDRHDVCNTSSFSMPNLNAIHGVPLEEHDNRKKTIRDFVINRLSKTDHEDVEHKTKIFSPNGYYMPPSTNKDSEKKLVIRRRLLQRLAKRKSEETNQSEGLGSHFNAKMPSQATSHLKFAKKLTGTPDSRLWLEKEYIQRSHGAAGVFGKEDQANNNWKTPLTLGMTEQNSGQKSMWNRHSPVKKTHSSVGIWNPADVHVKRERSTPEAQSDVSTHGSSVSSPCNLQETESRSRPPSANAADPVDDGEPVDSKKESAGEKEEEENSEDEEENVDVENIKDEVVEESGESESDIGDEDVSSDEKRNKRTRKTDKPRKRLKAM